MSITKRKIVLDDSMSHTNFDDVMAWIDTQQADSLRIVSAAIHNRLLYFRRQRTAVAAAMFTAGDRVQFRSKREQRMVAGRINRINRTTANLTTDDGMRWKVSLSMLQPV